MKTFYVLGYVGGVSLCMMLLVITAGCSRDGAGMIITHDGRLVSETPEIANQEFAWHLARRVASSIGHDWKATAAIREMPVLHQVKADEYGWDEMHIDIQAVPPRGSTVDAQMKEKIDAAVKEVAVYRATSLRKVYINTVITDAGAPLPGSLSYTSVAGDTWAGISTAFYGTPQHWRVIADANPGIDAAPLPPGSVLVIPPKP